MNSLLLSNVVEFLNSVAHRGNVLGELRDVCESTFLEIYLFKKCPEGKICGKFLKKRQKCTLSKVGFDQTLR